jgi:hypothetical protein
MLPAARWLWFRLQKNRSSQGLARFRSVAALATCRWFDFDSVTKLTSGACTYRDCIMYESLRVARAGADEGRDAVRTKTYF